MTRLAAYPIVGAFVLATGTASAKRACDRACGGDTACDIERVQCLMDTERIKDGRGGERRGGDGPRKFGS